MNFFFCHGFLWLDVCLGLEPSLAQSKAKIKWKDTLVKPTCPNWREGREGPCTFFMLYLGIRLTAEEKSRETSVRVSERRLTEQRWARFVKSNWRSFFFVVSNNRLTPVAHRLCVKRSGSTLYQRIYLQSCRNNRS